jgi:hypothetical protein
MKCLLHQGQDHTGDEFGVWRLSPDFVIGITEPWAYMGGMAVATGITIELRKTWKYGGEALHFRDNV